MDSVRALAVSSCLIIPTCGIAFYDALSVSTERKYLIPFMAFLNLGYILCGTQLPRGMPAYLTGVLTSWITLRTFILFGIHGNPGKYLRLEARPDQSGRCRLIWTSPLAPTKSKVSSLYWALELMTDFRGTRWCYSSQEGRPCDYHRRVERSTDGAINKHQGRGFNAALRTVFRFTVVSTFLWLYNTRLHPALRTVILESDSHLTWADAIEAAGFAPSQDDIDDFLVVVCSGHASFWLQDSLHCLILPGQSGRHGGNNPEESLGHFGSYLGVWNSR